MVMAKPTLDEQIAELKETLNKTIHQAKAPPLPVSQAVGLPPEQLKEKTVAHNDNFYKLATEVSQAAYQAKHKEINSIPPMLGALQKFSPEQVKVEIDKRAQIAGLKAGFAAAEVFIHSGNMDILKATAGPADTRKISSADIVAVGTPAKPEQPKISSADLHAKFFSKPPELPTKYNAKTSPPPLPGGAEPPPLLSRVNALGEAGAVKEQQATKQKAEAAAKADLDAMPPLLSTKMKR
jgi:hypothetical protein